MIMFVILDFYIRAPFSCRLSSQYRCSP